MKSPKKLYSPVDVSQNQIHPLITFFQMHTAKLFIKTAVNPQE